MTCSERRVAAFVSGDLPPEEQASFDDHLLACELCWRAVQEDRRGRLAVDQLREPAPGGLAERVRFAVELEARQPAGPTRELPIRRRLRLPTGPAVRNRPANTRRVRLALAGLLLVAGLGAGIGLGVGLSGTAGPADPPAVAAVAAMARQVGVTGAHLPGSSPGERLVLGGQPLVLRSYVLHGTLTLVATSSRPFAMPAEAHVLDGSSARAWMAVRGDVGLYCVNAAGGSESMLAAAVMPAVELPGLLADGHLMPA